MIEKDRNKRDYLVYGLQGTMCVSHTGYLAYGNSKKGTVRREQQKVDSKKGTVRLMDYFNKL